MANLLTQEELKAQGKMQDPVTGQIFDLPTPPTSELTAITTDNAINTVQKSNQMLDKLSGTDTRYQMTSEERQAGQAGIQAYNARIETMRGTPKETKPITAEPVKEPGKIKFINVDGQTKEISGESITPEALENLKNEGYYSLESTGDVPSWALTGDIETGRQNALMAQARKEKEDLVSNLSKFMISDEVLNSQISVINDLYNARISDMERINAQRTGATKTLGVRLGTRYTGGTGGAYGGVIAEEERQASSRITDLQAQKQNAISAAKQAAITQNWQVYSKQVDLAQKTYEEQLSAVKDLNKTIAENNKKINDQRIKASRDSAISGLISQGITDPNEILDYLNYDESGNMIGDFTAKEISDVLTNLLPEGKKINELTTDEAILERLKASGTMPKDATIFDYWQKQKDAKTNQVSTDPTLEAIRQMTLKNLQDEVEGYIYFEPTVENMDFVDGFKGAVSDATLGQQKFRGRYFSDLMERGELEKAREYIFQTALETAGTEQQKTIGGAADTLKAMNAFNDLLTQMTDAGVPTNIITGSAEEIARKLGQTTNPVYVDFKSRISKILFDYRKAMTGVQFSFAEGEQYKQLFPAYTNDISVNSQLIDSMENSLSMQVENFYTRKMGKEVYNNLISEGSLSQYGIKTGLSEDIKLAAEAKGFSEEDIIEAIKQKGENMVRQFLEIQ